MSLRCIAEPFVAAAPGGARVRTRLRVGADDAALLFEVGEFLGSLAGRDLAARCREGRLDAKGKAESRKVRKRALTAESSSRWAGAITRTSEDQYRLAVQNMWAERGSLAARIATITARLAAPAGGKVGTGQRAARGYRSKAERHAKTIRLQALTTRMATVEADLAAGAVHVVRGGKALLHNRNSLIQAGLTPDQWRKQWAAQRLFITADGEKDKAWGNETIRWNPNQGWVDIRLPTALGHLANRPNCRYRLACPVEFTYRGDEVAAQAQTGPVRYDISLDPDSGRWYLDASWRMPIQVAPEVDQLRQHPVVSVDVNDGHLAISAVSTDGNILGKPRTITVDLAGLPTTTRDAHLRSAVTDILTQAQQIGARAIVIENLDFADARAQGRENHGNRPSRGKKGRRCRAQIAGIPTAKFRNRLTQMAANAGLAIIVIDPAYTSKWAAQHWLTPLRHHHPQTSGHHAAALVIGRRGLGYRARRRVTTNLTAPAEAAQVNNRDTRTTTVTTTAPPERPTSPRDRRQPPGTKTAGTHRTRKAVQATHDRSGPPTKQNSLLLSV
ncbi:MAG: transposase [Actinomycetia bacterium]|nr:transposase [Actinomycetes bacterium]